MASEKSVARTIPASRASRDMDDVLLRVKSGREHFVLEEDGEAVAAIISMDEYRVLMEEREQLRDRQNRLQQFREAARAIGQMVQSSGLSEEEIMADLEQAKKETYREHYGDG